MSSDKTQIAKLSLEEKVKLFKKRFACREDAFYQKHMIETLEVDHETGVQVVKMKNIFRLVCKNDGDMNLCLIAQRKGKCFQCSNKVNEVLNDAWVRGHILGSKTLCLVPITAEGAKFGAIDFDRSVEEGLSYVFEDAKRVREYLTSKGFPSYIARSSNKGYHLYFFFKDWVKPGDIQSFVLHVLNKTGFIERQATHSIPLPEMFPKQHLYNKDSDGNGIRVPMSEPDARRGRNCFVNDSMEAYPVDMQWDLMGKMEEIDPEFFNKFLADEKVELFSDGVGTKGARSKKKSIKKEDGSEEVIDAGDTTPPSQYGSFWNVVGACPAMQEYWTKTAQGKYVWDVSNPKGLFNSARVASMNLALATLDGEEALKKRWPTPQTEQQIDLAKRHGYKPCTCRWMQMSSVCHINKHPKFGSYCHKKLPPIHIENGKIIENPNNLPETEWDDPSPIRHATDKNLTPDQIKEKFGLLARSLKSQSKKDAGEETIELDDKGHPVIKDLFVPENPADLLENLIRKIVKLPRKDRDAIKQHVVSNKWMSGTEWNQRLKSAGGDIHEEKAAEIKKTYKHFSLKNKHYYLKDDTIVCSYTDAKGNVYEDVLWNFWIERLEEPAVVKLVDDESGSEKVTYEDRNYKLVIHVGGQHKAIEVSNKVFANNNSFFEAVRKAGGTDLRGPMSSKDDYDVHMAAISYFSNPTPEKHALKDIGYYSLKGGTKYIMPSVIVTKDEIVRNDAYLINMDTDYSRPLDFQIIDVPTFKEVSRHIVDDLFNCNNRMMVMSTFAHAMSSVCTKIIEDAKGWRKAPVLWVCGDFGDGKTFVFEHIQYFFGNFSQTGPSGAGGSYVAKIGAAYIYRHSVLMLEDYKADLEKDGGMSMKKFIQHAYDRVGNPAMKRDGTMRNETPRVRGLIAVSGEDILEREASAISRLIVVEGKYGGRIKEGSRVQKMKHLYSGFTPYVIKAALQMPTESVLELWNHCFERLINSGPKQQAKLGGHRICENYALNLFGLRLALETMAQYGALSPNEVISITEEHLANLIKMKNHQLALVASARGSTSFMEDLRSLLADPMRYRIDGWPGTPGAEDARNAKVLGFCNSKHPDVIFLYPGLAYQAVAEVANRSRGSLKSMGHITRQLVDDGVIVKELCLEGRNYCKRKNPARQMAKVFPIKAEALGFSTLSALPNYSPSVSTSYSDDELFAVE